MTLVPECFLARELEMCYVPVCYVTNFAEGVREKKYAEGELFEGLLSAEEKKEIPIGDREASFDSREIRIHGVRPHQKLPLLQIDGKIPPRWANIGRLAHVVWTCEQRLICDELGRVFSGLL